jgi:4,5-DOPA dioxygenase extradiol
LDHGAWSVLVHMFPQADIPVVQLSMDENQPPAAHYDIGRRLMPLREEGVLVVGSGNLVHNLARYRWGEQEAAPFDWAVGFESRVRQCLLDGDPALLVDYLQLGDDARLAVPTPDHYLPFLYALGMRRKKEPVNFPVEGVDGGSVSMLAVRFG